MSSRCSPTPSLPTLFSLFVCFALVVHDSSSRIEAEVAVLDHLTCVFKSGTSVTFYVIGAEDENELILSAVLEALYEALLALFKCVNSVAVCPLFFLFPFNAPARFCFTPPPFAFPQNPRAGTPCHHGAH